MPRGKAAEGGVYVLLVELGEEAAVGKASRFALSKGFYAYVGSALGGLEKRIARHLSPKKKPHWHIDYLLARAGVRAVICAPTREREECFLAQALGGRLPSIAGFGSSDCRCPSHLFFSPDEKELKGHVHQALQARNLRPLAFPHHHRL